MRQKIWSLTQSLRIYSICILCKQYHNDKMAVCSHCIELMPLLGPGCHHCAYPLPDTQFLVCGHCIKNPPSFDRAFIKYTFEEPLRTLLHQFKYHNGLYLTSFLSYLIFKSLSSQVEMPQCLIPVPMHPQRIKRRGFNQAAILARSLAKKFKLPCDLFSCQKTLNTKPQAGLDEKQRKINLRSAFVTHQLPYQHVAIIDDLLTTGNTANELAYTLKKSGVKQVDVWCCARTIEKH
ncbi:ComF family protein [Legionella longbeachae]|uniref:Competence protein ComF n=1 Tax=Legionella longbeachae serogroup 1 (strain NSW150) TaxID=661367 RepID=D3HPT2_LEGLN|nr:competence protein ComF [Legionella longbeachae NSW150]VEE01418.1 competence protein ComF [Legionella oakridgensis]